MLWAHCHTERCLADVRGSAQFMGDGVTTFGGDQRVKTSGLSGDEGSADPLRREARAESGAVRTAHGSL